MSLDILIANLTSPVLLFFVLGIIATLLKSDLEIPASSFKFISIYLLFSIGFKGGQELAHSHIDRTVLINLLIGVAISACIPLYTFFILKKKLDVQNAGAIAAAYGSVSAVTFVSASSFLESIQIHFDGYLVAVMAFMEFPAIIVGVLLMNRYDKASQKNIKILDTIKHSISNGSVLIIFGSLVIGYVSNIKQALEFKPFTTDIFKGFLAIFLLEMGITTAKRFSSFRKQGKFFILFSVIIPLINGSIVALLSHFFTVEIGNRFIFSILAASASYIAVPAAMRIIAPKAEPGIYIPMALGVTFPFNIAIGFPVYFYLVNF